MIRKILIICFFIACNALLITGDVAPAEVRYTAQDFSPWLIALILVCLAFSVIRFSLISSLIGVITCVVWVAQVGVGAVPQGDEQSADFTVITQDIGVGQNIIPTNIDNAAVYGAGRYGTGAVSVASGETCTRESDTDNAAVCKVRAVDISARRAFRLGNISKTAEAVPHELGVLGRISKTDNNIINAENSDVTPRGGDTGAPRAKRVPGYIKDLLENKPDILTLQGIKNSEIGELVKALSPTFAFWHIFGTVGIWSKMPIENAVTLQLGGRLTLGGKIDVKIGEEYVVRFYIVNFPQNPLFQSAPARDKYDEIVKDLSAYLQKEDARKIVMLGNFGMSSRDSRFKKILKTGLQRVHTASWGFDFTWPSVFPVIDLDHVLVRGLRGVGGKLIKTEDSAHRGIFIGLGE